MGISQRNKFLDKLHRQTVNGILVVSGFCAVYLGYRIYRFMAYTRPILREKRHHIEQELLSEGKPLEEDLSTA